MTSPLSSYRLLLLARDRSVHTSLQDRTAEVPWAVKRYVRRTQSINDDMVCGFVFLVGFGLVFFFSLWGLKAKLFVFNTSVLLCFNTPTLWIYDFTTFYPEWGNYLGALDVLKDFFAWSIFIGKKEENTFLCCLIILKLAINASEENHQYFLFFSQSSFRIVDIFARSISSFISFVWCWPHQLLWWI